jgi:hypothetical protein
LIIVLLINMNRNPNHYQNENHNYFTPQNHNQCHNHYHNHYHNQYHYNYHCALVAGQPHVQLDPWRAPTGRVQDCRVCHRRRQWTIRVPFNDRYKDVSARKGDKDILPMVGTRTFFLLMAGTLLDGTNVRLNWNIESDMNVYWI